MKIRLSIAVGSDGPTVFDHCGPVIRIGRDPGCELPLAGEAGSTASRQHARIDLGAGGATVTDLGSSNGTLLNGGLLERPSPLRVGDRIQMGFTGATITVLALDLDTTPAGKTARTGLVLAIGAVAAVAIVAGVVAVVWPRTNKGPDEYAQGPTTAPDSVPLPPDTRRLPMGDTGKQPAPPPPVLPPPWPVKPARSNPSEEVKEVGTYINLDKWVSVLLRREGEDRPWAVLRPESRVSTAQTLVSLPGYRSLLALDGGVDLTLWGNLPEFSPSPPVLESVVMLHVPAAGTDLDFTLDRGRVVVANRTAPARSAKVRLRFLRETWELELPHGSEVALESWGQPQRQAAPPTWLSLVAKGRVVVKTSDQTLINLPNCARVIWLNQGAARPERADAPDLPAWWTKSPDPAAKPVEKALRSLLEWRNLLGGPGPGPGEKQPRPNNTEPVMARVKKQVQDVNDPDNQDVGVLFLAALDVVEPLVDLLGERDKSNVRGVTLFALQSWLARGGQHARELKAILVRRGHGDGDAELIVRLLHFFPAEALGERKTYKDLIDQLDHDNLLVRDLSFWQLDQLGVGGHLPEEARKIEFDPAWGQDKRRPAVEQWKKLIADGKVPVPSRR